MENTLRDVMRDRTPLSDRRMMEILLGPLYQFGQEDEELLIRTPYRLELLESLFGCSDGIIALSESLFGWWWIEVSKSIVGSDRL